MTLFSWRTMKMTSFMERRTEKGMLHRHIQQEKKKDLLRNNRTRIKINLQSSSTAKSSWNPCMPSKIPPHISFFLPLACRPVTHSPNSALEDQRVECPILVRVRKKLLRKQKKIPQEPKLRRKRKNPNRFKLFRFMQLLLSDPHRLLLHTLLVAHTVVLLPPCPSLDHLRSWVPEHSVAASILDSSVVLAIHYSRVVLQA
jgi:hypothetical protein